jgi:hypothetical protein
MTEYDERKRGTRKSVDALERLERSGALTEDGKAWIIQALDPFHDTEFAPTDMPDFSRQGCIVQCIKRTMTVSKPATIEAAHPGENWDCHVSTGPFLAATAMAVQNVQGRSLTAIPGTSNPNWSAVNIVSTRNNGTPAVSYPRGVVTPLWMTSGGNTDATINGLACTSDLTDPSAPGFLNGQHRLVGFGVEIINTSPDLTAQGSVTVYRQPLTVNTTDAAFSAAPALTAISFQTFQFPPPLATDAFLLEGTRQWHAREGAYLVSTPATLDNPVVDPQANYFMVAQSRISGVEPNPYPVLVGPNTDGPYALAQFNTAGAYFSGLASTNTLTVNVRFFVTRYPSFLESDMAVVSRPSPELDTLALEIFSHSLRKLPPGCPVSENPLGEWFSKVVKGVGGMAHRVAPLIEGAHPGLGKVARLAAAATNQAGVRVMTPSTRPDASQSRVLPIGTKKKKKAVQFHV